ncbi:MAG TPA: hypothetical protein VIC53_02780 [Wenzhouxiangella sp.]
MSTALGLALLLSSSVLASDYSLILDVWVSGEKQAVDQPLPLSHSGASWVIEGQYRIDFSIDPIDDPLAPDGSVWLTADIYDWDGSENDWVFFTDTLLGAPVGQRQALSISSQDGKTGRRGAALYVEALVERAEQ